MAKIKYTGAFEDAAPRYRESRQPSRHRATVKWFHSHKEFGFVVADNGHDAILFASELRKGGIDPDDVTAGTVLEIVLARSSKGYIANEVSLVEHGRRPVGTRGEGVVIAVQPDGSFAFCRDAWNETAYCGGKIVAELTLKVGDKITFETRQGSRGAFVCNAKRI